MDVGKFRIRAEFQTRGSTIDEYGQESQTFTTLATVGVHVTELSGNDRQQFNNGVATEEDFIRIMCRYKSTLDTIQKNARVVVEGRNYEIVGMDRRNYRGQYLQFVLREDR